MASSIGMTVRGVVSRRIDSSAYDPELEPYMSLFMKPLSSKKSGFSKRELAVMCKDPLHSPRLIRYLIDFVKEM